MRSPSGARPRRRSRTRAHRPGGGQRRAPRRWRRRRAGSSRAPPRPRCRRRRRARTASSGASAPWRRSSSQPNSATASTQVAAYQRSSAKNGAVATRHHSPSSGPTTATSDESRTRPSRSHRRQRDASAIETTGRCGRIGADARDLARAAAAAGAACRAPAAAPGVGELGALELRRALAQPRAAVRALGDEARTSDPQFLHTTKRSGAGVTAARSYCARAPCEPGRALGAPARGAAPALRSRRPGPRASRRRSRP